MATTIGTIELIAKIDTSQYKKGEKEITQTNKNIEESAEKTADRSAGAWKSFSDSVTKYAKVAAFATAAVFSAVVVSSVKSYAEYEQLVGGVDTLFKDSSKQIQGYADEAYKTAGLSANQYMSTITSFSARLIQGLGGDTKRAAEIGNKAILDMSDNANKMGTDITMIQMAYQGLAKQNFTMLDNLKLGYGGTAGEMARLINESGVLGKAFEATADNVKDVSFDKMIEAIHVVQDRMGITGTTATEAAGTISGAFNSTKSAWTNLMVAFGTGNQDKVRESFDALATSGKNLVDNVLRIMPGLLEGIGQSLGMAVKEIPVIGGFFDFVIRNKDIFLPIAVGIGTIIVAIKAWQMATMALTVAQGALNAVMAANPIGLIILAVAALTAGLIYFFTQTETGRKLWDTFSKTMVDGFNAIKGAVMGVFNWVKSNWPLLLGIILGPFGPAVVAIIKNFDTIKNAFSSVWNWIKGTFSTIGQVATNAIRVPVNAIIGFANRYINGFVNSMNSIIETFNKIPGAPQIPTARGFNIPMLAEGAIVSKATLAVIGEGPEPEAVVPLSKLDDMGRGNITINISGTFATSASEQRKVAQQIADALKDIDNARGGLNVRY